MHSGWLNKEGGLLISKWQRRWFELHAQAGKLKYYLDNQGTATARGEILLENATLQGPKEVLEQKSVDHGFSITTAKGRTYFFHSDRADDTREWLAQLRTAIARAGKSSSAATPASHTPSAAATASGSSKASKPAGAPASSMDDSVGGGLLSFADLSVRNNPQTTSMTLPGSRSSALGVKPRVRSLTADFQRHRQKRPARPKVAQDQDKMAQRVYNLLYKPRQNLSAQAFEQSVVPWHPSGVCSICHAKKTFYGKHPCCRLCGEAVCEQESCSNLLNLTEVGSLVNVLQKGKRPAFQTEKDGVITVCTNCEHTLQDAGRTAQLTRGAKSDTPLQRLYNEARASQKKAQENLDKLKRIVISINEGNTAVYLREQVRELGDAVQHDLGDVKSTADKIGRLKTESGSATRARFQLSIKKALQDWSRERMVEVVTCLNAGGR